MNRAIKRAPVAGKLTQVASGEPAQGKAEIVLARKTPAKLGQTIADAIRNRIAHGDLRDGDTLPNERAMQEQYGISRATLREALRSLESEGLITSPRGGVRGARVHAPTAAAAARCAELVLQVRGATIADVFAVRALVEPEAARLLALRRPLPDLSRLDSLLAAMRASNTNPRELGRLLALFNEALLNLSGNEALRLVGQIISQLMLKNVPVISERVDDFPEQTREGIATSHKALENLIAAVRRGDSIEAERILKETMAFLRALHTAELPVL